MLRASTQYFVLFDDFDDDDNDDDDNDNGL